MTHCWETRGSVLSDTCGCCAGSISVALSSSLSSSKQNVGSNLQPVCVEILSHFLSSSSTSRFSPLTTYHHFVIEPLALTLYFLLIRRVSASGSDTSRLMAFVTAEQVVDRRVPHTFVYAAKGTTHCIALHLTLSARPREREGVATREYLSVCY